MKMLKSKKAIGPVMITSLFIGGTVLLVGLLLGWGVFSALAENKILVAIAFFAVLALVGIFRK